MFLLMKLEYRKAQFHRLLFLSIMAIPFLIYWCVWNNGGHPDGYLNYAQAFNDVHYYVNTTFLVISSIVISRIALEEYRTKTITVLFTYPHPRSKLMLTKLIFIGAFVLLSSIFASVLVMVFLVLYNFYTHTIPGNWTVELIEMECYRVLFYSVGSLGISFVCYYFGMLRKSIPATIMPAFLLSVVSSEYYEGSFPVIIGVSFGWLLIGLWLAVITIKKESQADVLP